MRKIVVLFSLAALSASLAVSAAEPPQRTMTAVMDNLDLSKNTKLHVKEYWRSIQGQEISGTGEVVDVSGGRSRIKILIADKSRPLYKGHNITVVTTDVTKAAEIKRGQKIHFKGILHGYSGKRAGAIIEVSDAQLL